MFLVVSDQRFFAVVVDFKFASGESLPGLNMHYRILGKPQRNAAGVVRNAVLILHGTTGSGAQFIRPEFAGELFGAGQPLDASKYFIVLLDGIGHGQSAKPSDGLRAKFPRYGYRDMVEAGHRMLTEGLGVNHLRLVMGTSMGGMHTWLWGELHPEFMDALMPLASLPVQISGRNRAWRRLLIDAVRNDPGWNGGDYKWDLRLNNAVPTDLIAHLGVGEVHMNAGSLNLRGVEVHMGVGELNLDLRGAPKRSYDVEIHGGVGEATVYLPKSVGITARATGGIGDVNVRGLEKHGGVWINPSHEHDSVMIHVDAKGGIGEIHIVAE